MIDTLLQFVKRLCAGGIVAIILFVAALTYFGGEQTTVTARGLGPTPCDVTIAGQCARHLATTTTTPSTTTPPVYGPDNPSDYIIVVDGQVTRVPRSTVTDAAIRWLLARGL